MKSVTVLGSTGSVGTNTLDVIAANAGDYKIHALTAGRNVELLARQARACHADLAVIADESHYQTLKSLLAGTPVKVAAGRQAIIDAASDPVDWTMASIMGFAGLEPLLASIRNGKNVAIANKEPLVAAGKIVMAAARASGATILPVDSEHNAIFQVFEKDNIDSIIRIILTASGGPFRTMPMEQMEHVTPQQALKHPNWSMGAKLTIDSSTMMNKALEVIEAHHLFALPPEQIDVLVHPQSIIHSMVEYSDGSVLAQMGASDMRVPIANALGWPHRIKGCAQRLDFLKLSNLTFESHDPRRFPAINFAYDCLKDGASACVALNAANEEAVAAFLAGQIGYLDIYRIVQKTVEGTKRAELPDLESIIFYDKQMRDDAKRRILDNEHSQRKVS